MAETSGVVTIKTMVNQMRNAASRKEAVDVRIVLLLMVKRVKNIKLRCK